MLYTVVFTTPYLNKSHRTSLEEYGIYIIERVSGSTFLCRIADKDFEPAIFHSLIDSLEPYIPPPYN